MANTSKCRSRQICRDSTLKNTEDSPSIIMDATIHNVKNLHNHTECRGRESTFKKESLCVEAGIDGKYISVQG